MYSSLVLLIYKLFAIFNRKVICWKWIFVLFKPLRAQCLATPNTLIPAETEYREWQICHVFHLTENNKIKEMGTRPAQARALQRQLCGSLMHSGANLPNGAHVKAAQKVVRFCSFSFVFANGESEKVFLLIKLNYLRTRNVAQWKKSIYIACL